MIQAIVVKGATSVRATVIANRTKSDELGIIKAMMMAQPTNPVGRVYGR